VVKIPVVVIEILLGILVGPDVLGWVVDNEILSVLAEFGLSMLIFMAGVEIQFRAIAGAPLRLAYRAWFRRSAAWPQLGPPCSSRGWHPSAIYVGLALATTAARDDPAYRAGHGLAGRAARRADPWPSARSGGVRADPWSWP